MGRLIPLMLGAFPLPPSESPTRRATRTASTLTPTVLLPIIPKTPTLAEPEPVEPLVPDAIEVKSQQRLPTPPRPKPVTDLIIMPYTEREWRKVMDEARVLYLKRQYKQCSARCIQVLDGVEDPYRVHPLYLIYLCFYAATSIEHTARSLHANSSDKIPLLQSSLDYYNQAESYMEYATFSADPTIISATRERTNCQIHHSTSSVASSLRSSNDSIFSEFSSASSTTEDSPTSSTFSADAAQKDDIFYKTLSNLSTSTPIQMRPRTLSDPSLAPAPLKLKKKVSFSLPADIPSPSKQRSTSAPTPSTSRASQPSTPSSTTSPPSSHDPSTISSFLFHSSLSHYRSHLSVFSSRLTYHRESIQNLISQVQETRKGRRSNTPEIFTDFPQRIVEVASPGFGRFDGFKLGITEGDEAGAVEAGKRDIQERIRRLKERGWKRERFNGEKYERLAQEALEELE